MRSSRSVLARGLVVLAMVSATAPSVLAAEAAAQESKDWEFRIVPYIWGAGIQGDVGIGRLPAQGVEASFSDIWNNLEIAGMAAFEARKGRWGVLVDAIYIDLGDTVPTPDPAYGNADVSMNQQLYSGLMTYRIYGAEKVTVDMGWGPRYVRIDSDLELTSGIDARAEGLGHGGLVGLARGRARHRPPGEALVADGIRGHRGRRVGAHLGGGGGGELRLQQDGVAAVRLSLSQHRLRPELALVRRGDGRAFPRSRIPLVIFDSSLDDVEE